MCARSEGGELRESLVKGGDEQSKGQKKTKRVDAARVLIEYRISTGQFPRPRNLVVEQQPIEPLVSAGESQGGSVVRHVVCTTCNVKALCINTSKRYSEASQNEKLGVFVVSLSERERRHLCPGWGVDHASRADRHA